MLVPDLIILTPSCVVQVLLIVLTSFLCCSRDLIILTPSYVVRVLLIVLPASYVVLDAQLLLSKYLVFIDPAPYGCVLVIVRT